MAEDMLASCGIYCSKCVIYRAANDYDFAIKLAKDWRESGHKDAQPDWFQCQGYMSDKSVCWTPDCAIQNCCNSKNINNCSECEELPCQSLKDWIGGYKHHAEAVERLIKWKQDKLSAT